MGFSIQIYAIFFYPAIFLLEYFAYRRKKSYICINNLKAIHNKDYSVVKTLRF